MLDEEVKDSEKIVYFVRHGQSEGNVGTIHQPINSPLTETGRLQAGRIAERVAQLQFDTLISSPYERARETSEVISKKTAKTPLFSDLFVERKKPTTLYGKPFEDSEAEALWKNWNESLYSREVRAEDGENFDDIVDRADKALKFLEEREEKALLVVTHGFFLKALAARVVLGETLTPENLKSFQHRIKIENTGLSAFVYRAYNDEMVWNVATFNDYAHLG